jgi:hypothetical protein
MIVPQAQIEFRKKVGQLKGKPVYHVKTRGGLHMISKEDGSLIATGPHGGVARHIAKKYEPEVEWTELAKAEHLEEAVLAHLLPKYIELSDRMRALQASSRD